MLVPEGYRCHVTSTLQLWRGVGRKGGGKARGEEAVLKSKGQRKRKAYL